MVIGDSFVAGLGDSQRRGWIGRAVGVFAVPPVVHNLGMPGHTSADIARRWRAQVMACRPADGAAMTLVFAFGANDCATAIDQRPRLEPGASFAHAETILTEAVSVAPNLMIGPAPIADDPAANARARDLCGALSALCLRLAIPYLPVLDALLADRRWMTEALAGDGAHPDHGGYQALAELVVAWPAWHDLAG